MRGNLDEATQTFFVYEVSAVTGVKSDVPGNVDFCSSKFYRREGSTGGSGGSGGDRPPEHEVNEEPESSGENHPVLMKVNATRFEFAKAFATRKTSTQTKQRMLIYIRTSLTVSLKCWNVLRDNHRCYVEEIAFRKLPAIGRCKMHLRCNDESPRCWLVVKVAVEGKAFYLMEVDTSDAAKALSTKIVVAAAAQNVEQNLAEFETRILKGSLSWPKAYFDAEFGEHNHFFIVHQTSDKPGEVSLEKIQRWAKNVYRNLLAYSHSAQST